MNPIPNCDVRLVPRGWVPRVSPVLRDVGSIFPRDTVGDTHRIAKRTRRSRRLSLTECHCTDPRSRKPGEA